MAFNFSTTQPTAPATNIQWNAIQNAANGNNLVSQLYAGKTPQTTASAANVKSPTAPQSNPFTTPSSTAAGAIGSGIIKDLSSNTQSFSPTTLATGNTPGASWATTTPQSTSQLATPKMTMGLATEFSSPQTATVVPVTTQNSAVYTNPNAASQQINTGAAGTPIQPPTPPTVPTQTGNKYTGILASTSQQGSQSGQDATSRLAETSAEGNPAATNYDAQTANYGAGNIAIAQQAENIANKYSTEENNLLNAAGPQYEAYLTGGGGPIGLGQAGAVQQSVADQLEALNAAAQTGLSGTSQAFTGQNQAANASNEAAGQANTIQSNVQSGLANAGSLANTAQSNIQSGEQEAAALAQPQTAAYGQTTFNPTTGQYTDEGGLPPSVMQQYAQMAADGQYSAIPSSITSNAVLSAQLNQAAKVINPNYNPIISTAEGAATAANTQTAGTAQAATAAQGYSTSLQNYSNANAAYQTATQQAKNVQDILASTGINSSNSQDWNSAINSLSARLGSANQASYIAGLNELQSTYTNLLSSVGAATPTVNGQQATAIFNPSSTPAQIDAAIQALNQAAYAKLQPLYQQVQQYQSSLNSASNNSSGSSIYNF